jgi:hypothetical protein
MDASDSSQEVDWYLFLADHPNRTVSPPMTPDELAQLIVSLTPDKSIWPQYRHLADLVPEIRLEAAKAILIKEHEAGHAGLMAWVDLKIQYRRAEAEAKRLEAEADQPRPYPSKPKYARPDIPGPKRPRGGLAKGHGKGRVGGWDWYD